MSLEHGLIVVPAYNEASIIEDVAGGLAGGVEGCRVVYIDDGSDDETARILRSLGHDVVRHPVNLGYVESLRTGIEIASSRNCAFVAFYDGDGQHRPEDLRRLIAYHREHAELDLLIGSRYLSGEKAAGFLRHLVSRAFSAAVRIATGTKVSDITSGLKLMNRKAMSLTRRMVLEDGHAELIVTLLRAGCRSGEIPISVKARSSGTSMYRPIKALLYPLRTMFLVLLACLSRPEPLMEETQ